MHTSWICGDCYPLTWHQNLQPQGRDLALLRGGSVRLTLTCVKIGLMQRAQWHWKSLAWIHKNGQWSKHFWKITLVDLDVRVNSHAECWLLDLWLVTMILMIHLSIRISLIYGWIYMDPLYIYVWIIMDLYLVYLWRCPKMGIPPNHPFIDGFSIFEPSIFLGTHGYPHL